MTATKKTAKICRAGITDQEVLDLSFRSVIEARQTFNIAARNLKDAQDALDQAARNISERISGGREYKKILWNPHQQHAEIIYVDTETTNATEAP